MTVRLWHIVFCIILVLFLIAAIFLIFHADRYNPPEEDMSEYWTKVVEGEEFEEEPPLFIG